MLRPVMLYLSRAFYGVALLIVSAIIARAWGAEGLGLYSALMTVLNIAIVFCVFGADIWFIEQSPKRAKILGEAYSVEAHRGEALTLVLLQSLLVLPFAVIAVHFASPSMEIVAVAILFMAVAQMIGNILVSDNRQLSYGLIMQVGRPLVFLAVLFIAAQQDSQLRHALMLGLCLSFAVGIAISFTVVRVSWQSIKLVLKNLNSNWLRNSLILVFLAAYNILFAQADRLIILHLRTAEEAGIYAAAQNILNLVNYAVNAIMTLAMPMISTGMAGNKSTVKLTRELQKLARPLWLFSLVFIPGFWLLGDYIFMLYGPGFGEATLPLIILSMGLSGGLLFGFPITVLTLSDQKGALVLSSVIVLVLTISLSILLVSNFGIIGAATSHAISNIASRAFFHFVCIRKTGVKSSVF